MRVGIITEPLTVPRVLFSYFRISRPGEVHVDYERAKLNNPDFYRQGYVNQFCSAAQVLIIDLKSRSERRSQLNSINQTIRH
ncbi:hypothetical protein FRX31_032084 [Thalictrum thalictroides]|uniref:Uncharacterized protein n=1 Tax=Thalictrum thalictroides TaxID=46969 RepID=A0A7J6V1V2_THATH|nr:hypothetical protein FRX31_032084 [Thalictrum thalictroides]